MQRRLAWRNERTLYKRKCDAPGHNEEIISIYHKDSPFKIYDQKYWWSDEWNPMDYGRDYDWNKPFFEQLKELILDVPTANLGNENISNSEYCNLTADSKNCYLLFRGRENENCFYSYGLYKTKDSVDVSYVNESELCFNDVNCKNCYKVFYSENCSNCIDSLFLSNCHNCNNCFGCVNLRNKQYHIFNRPYPKDEYLRKINTFDFGSYQLISEILKRIKMLKLNTLYKYADILASVNVSGNYIKNSKNLKFCFDVQNLEESKYVSEIYLSGSSSYDISVSAKIELYYECLYCGVGFNNLFSAYAATDNSSLRYCFYCVSSNSNLFGCIGLRHKQYCILNKQYTKSEYENLIPKIIQHMNDVPYIDKKGRIYKYGEFFPLELSPFSYNETVAQEYFPLTKEQALNKGYSWKEPEKRNYKIDLKTEDLPDHIKDVKDDILGKVIECQHQGKCQEQCTQGFKIIEPALAFYRKMNLPLPRLCPNCRHYQRIKQRNPLKLWQRKCQCAGAKSDNGIYQNTIEHSHHKQEHCPNEFETSYASDKPEIVYCEKCYLEEVV